MPTPQELTDVVAALDVHTTAAGVRIDQYNALIKESMSRAEVDTVTTALTGVANRLKAMGHDPQNPIPPEPLPPEPHPHP